MATTTTKKTTVKKTTAAKTPVEPKKAVVKKTPAKKAEVKKAAVKMTTAPRKKTLTKAEFLAAVRDRAYEIYLQRDPENGCEISDWLAAEADVAKAYKLKK